MIDIGFPVMTYRRFGTEFRWQFCEVISYAGGLHPEQTNSTRTTIFPVYWHQSSVNPAENYTAVFPIYGHLINRVFRDEIYFFLFPIYGESRKKDVVTDNYLYPIFHLRHGDGLKGWQLWPLVAHEYKVPTWSTNGFDEVELSSGHENHFVLWPLYLEQTLGIGTTNVQKEWASFPAYTRFRSPQRDSTSIMTLFSHTVDREKKYSEWGMPWPFIVFTRGEGKATSRVWPLFSKAHNATLQSDFYLWPIYKYNRVHSDPLDRSRTRIVFFLYSYKNQKNTETGQAQRRIDLWPLFTRTSDYNGNSRLQIVSLLEPLLSDSVAVERNLSPLWAVWRSEHNPSTHASSQSLLWNLYRLDTSAHAKKCSLLMGLFQYQSGSEGKQLRLLYVPVVKTRAPKTQDGARPSGSTRK